MMGMTIVQALKRFSFFDKTQKFEDAVDNYTKAGNCFKVSESVSGSKLSAPSFSMVEIGKGKGPDKTISILFCLCSSV